MRKIIFALLTVFLFGFDSPLFAQEVEVSGKYGKFNIYIKYLEYEKDKYKIKGLELKYDGSDLPKLITDLKKERDNAIAQLKNATNPKQAQPQSQSQSQSQSQGATMEDSLLRQQNNTLLENKWMLEDSLKSLQGTVGLLEDSVRLLNASLDNVNKQLASLLQKPTTPSGTFQHVGAYYRLGFPINFFNQKDTKGNKIWERHVTPSHQVGLYWNSASFSDKLPMTYGVGLEYSWMKFLADMDNLKDILPRVPDNDGDYYTAYYTYNNVTESATLHCLSIPLSFSIGAPQTNRISGYFQVSLVPSFPLLASDFSASGVYSCAGLYDTVNGSQVNLYLDDFSPLGFGSDSLQAKKPNKEDVLPFMLSGRIAGGVYIPLCNTAKGQTSPWVIKMGVNLDMGFFFSKQKEAEHPNAKYHLDQYNILTGSGRLYINPGIEVGVLYMFNK